jgi:hypothetical protein
VTGTTVEVVGLERLQSTLSDAADKLGDLSAVNRDVAAAVAAAVRAPKRTGRLAASVRPKPTKTDAAVVASAPYASVIEYGSTKRHIRANPFLATAFANTEKTTTAMYAKALQGIADDVKGA